MKRNAQVSHVFKQSLRSMVAKLSVRYFILSCVVIFGRKLDFKII